MRRSPNTIANATGMGRELIAYWIALAGSLGVALVAGYWVGTENTELLVLCVALVIMALLVLGLRQRVWVLVPIFWTFGSGTLLLKIPFSPRDIMVMLAFCGYGSYVTLSKKDTRQPWIGLDWILFLNIIYLVGTYLLHPVGFRALGGESMGGRPYMNIAMAVVAYRLLVRMPDSPKTVSWMPIFLSASVTIMTLLQALAYLVPGTTPLLYFLFSNIDFEVFVAEKLGVEGTGRFKGLADFAASIFPVLCAYYPPSTLFDFRRGRFYVMCAGAFCMLMGGFRSVFLNVAAAIGIGAFLHRGWRGVVQVSLVGGALLCVLVAGNGRLFELPLGAQRTLSFLPGEWDIEIKAEADESARWRFELWADIVKQGSIRDWWFGDGFAVRLSDQPAIGRGGMTDNALISGGFHNGPLTAIRFVGVFGMVLYYAFMLAGAYYSVKAVRLCRGTILQPLAYFLAIRLIWAPIFYTLVFGAYNTAMPEQIFYAAVLRLTLRMGEELRAPAAARHASHSMLPGAFAGEPI